MYLVANRQTLFPQCRMSVLMNVTTDRRSFLAYFSSLGLTSTLFPGVLWARLSEVKAPEGKTPEAAPPPLTQLTKDMLRDAAAISGLEFTDEQLDKMLKGVTENTVKLEALRKMEIDNSIAPPLYFNPVL